MKLPAMITLLVDRGPATTVELAAKTGASSNDASKCLRRWVNNNQYGVYILGKEWTAGKQRTNLWDVDRIALSQYMARQQRANSINAAKGRAAKAALKAKREGLPFPPEPKAPVLLIPDGPYRTQWRQSSPYYREVA